MMIIHGVNDHLRSTAPVDVPPSPDCRVIALRRSVRALCYATPDAIRKGEKMSRDGTTARITRLWSIEAHHA